MPGSWILSGKSLANHFSLVPTSLRSRANRHSPASGVDSAARSGFAAKQNAIARTKRMRFMCMRCETGHKLDGNRVRMNSQNWLGLGLEQGGDETFGRVFFRFQGGLQFEGGDGFACLRADGGYFKLGEFLHQLRQVK